MTEQEMQQLSREVAALYGIEPFTHSLVEVYPDIENVLWLHDDSARVFDLCAKAKVNLFHSLHYVNAYYLKIDRDFSFTERYSEHNNNEEQAARIAALKALKAKKECER